jgi:hypothetical protein
MRFRASVRDNVKSIYYELASWKDRMIVCCFASTYEKLAILKELFPAVSQFVGKVSLFISDPVSFFSFMTLLWLRKFILALSRVV